MTDLLATPEAFAAIRGVTYDPTDLAAVIALEAASETVRRYCKRLFTYVEDDEIVLDGTGRAALLLPEYPVVEVTSVLEDDVELTVDEDYHLAAGILYRLDGGTAYGAGWTIDRANVAVTYSHGYTLPTDPTVTGVDPLPSDLQLVVMQMAARVHATPDGRTLESEGIGTYNVSYGGTDTVALPAVLPLEATVLDSYRDVRYR